jgi:SHS2 domain-containing protein
MLAMYELFDHTADLGLRARAADPDALFADMARALTAALVENPDAVQPRQTHAVRLDGADREYLLLDWLAALLDLYERERFLAAECRVRLRPDGLDAEVRGEPADAARHLLSHEVKAITYHGLRVEQDADGWLAEAIVDI